MSETFYTAFEVAQDDNTSHPVPNLKVTYDARIAVYDDLKAAPRVEIIKAQDIRQYLDEITKTTYSLAREQGGSLPFMIIRECVENLIHAYFTSPVISVLDGGNTIRLSDSGPGIQDKDLALEFGSTTATEEMKHYIRGVGSGLPYVQEYLYDKQGSLRIEDNLHTGCIVTISLVDHGADSLEKADHSSVSPAIRSSDVAATSAYIAAPSTYTADFSVKEREALSYLACHNAAGPKEIARAMGYGSVSTWSRVLHKLAGDGYLKKGTQKYSLLPSGVFAMRTLGDAHDATLSLS